MVGVGLVGIGEAGTHHARALVLLFENGAARWPAVRARDPIDALVRNAHAPPT